MRNVCVSLSPEPSEVVSGASPSLEVIHLHTKNITQSIQELLQAAQTQRQSRWDQGGNLGYGALELGVNKEGHVQKESSSLCMRKDVSH